VEGERRSQEAGLEDRDARAEPVARAEPDLVLDVGRRVDVDEIGQVDRARVDEPEAENARVRQDGNVRVALLDRPAEADGRVEERVGTDPEDRSPGLEVELRRARWLDGDLRVVAVDDRSARLEAAERVGGDLVGGARDVRVPVRRRRPVQCGLDDRRRRDALSYLAGCSGGSLPPTPRPVL